MKRSVHSKINFKKYLLLVAVGIQSLLAAAQSGSGAPELVFKNPVLTQGQLNKQGAVYRFANVAPGVDAEVKLKKFSRNDITMRTVDNSALGWDKAFQPEFGLPGLVQPNQNWYIDFELTFFKAGRNQRQRMEKVVLTTLDVDGDGVSVAEYATMNNPSSVAYSTISYLQGLTSITATIGQTFTCQTCGLPSVLIACSSCGGDGLTNSGNGNNNDCDDCDGTGKRQLLCGHAYSAPATIQGPTENFTNIDTLATQVMATYTYLDKDKITFRYGAKSGSQSSNGAGIRLNSMWYKSFNLASATTLPVKLSSFAAFLNKKDVNLSWVGSEENFSHYILQRSIDGKEFSDIAIIFANSNNSGNATEYKFKDANVASVTGTLFYRLQMVDKTEEAGKYSDVRVIRLGKETSPLQLITYPNPVVNQVRVTLPSEWQGKPVMIELYTANGTRVQSMQLGSASQTETLDVARTSKGFYLVKATCEGQTAQQRIVKN